MTLALRPDQRFLIHLASGGLGHSLHHLGNSLAYADASSRMVIPCFEAYPTFAVPFWDVFSPRSSLICDAVTAQEALTDFAATVAGGDGLTLSTFQRLHGPGGMSIPAVGERPLPGLAPIWIPWTSQRSKRFLVCDGVFKHGTGLRGRLEQAWFETRTRRTSGLLRALTELRVRAPMLERTRTLRASVPERFVGVHFRNTDRHSDLAAYLDRTRLACERAGGSDVYWATDDASSLDEAKAQLTGLRVHGFARIQATEGRSWGNLHYASDEQLRAAGLSRQARLEDALGDIFMLAHADSLVANQDSALSRMAFLLQKSPGLRKDFMPAEGSTESFPKSADA